MNLILLCLMWIMGMWGDDDVVDRIRARARCRQIRVQRSEVVVKFTSEEDARLFAEDLESFVSD
jgi:hypothetical protein